MQSSATRIGSELVPVVLVVTSLVGTLGLVISMHRRPPVAAKASVAVVASKPAPVAHPAPSPPPPPPQEETPAPPAEDPTTAAVARLVASEAEQRQAAEAADRRVAVLEAAKRTAVARSEQWRRREMLVRAQVDALDRDARRMEDEADTLAAERDILAREADSLRADLTRARSHSGAAILPYRGPNGTWRVPIAIECRNGCVTLQPGGPTVSFLDLSSVIGLRENPLLLAVAARRRRIAVGETPDGAPAEPYVVFVVRPDGIRPYYAARTRLEMLGGLTFGYELVEQDADIEFPDLTDVAEWKDTAPPRHGDGARELASPTERHRGTGGGGDGRGNGGQGQGQRGRDYVWHASPAPELEGVGELDRAGTLVNVAPAPGPFGDGTNQAPEAAVGGPRRGVGGLSMNGGSPGGGLLREPAERSSGGLTAGRGAPPRGAFGTGASSSGSPGNGFPEPEPLVLPGETGSRLNGEDMPGASTAPSGMPATNFGSQDGNDSQRRSGGGSVATARGPSTGDPSGTVDDGQRGGSGSSSSLGAWPSSSTSVRPRGSSPAAGHNSGQGALPNRDSVVGDAGATGSHAPPSFDLIDPGDAGSSGSVANASQAARGGPAGGSGSSRQSAGGSASAGSGGSSGGSASAGSGASSATQGAASGSSGVGLASASGPSGAQGSPAFDPHVHYRKERKLELVVECRKDGVTVIPEGLHLTNDDLDAKAPRLLAALRDTVEEHKAAQPDVDWKPRVKFLVRPGGEANYWKARAQTVLTGLGWPFSLQIAEGEPVQGLSRKEQR